MTEPPTRTIAGLTPRSHAPADLSRLQRRNRADAAPDQPATVHALPTRSEPAMSSAPAEDPVEAPPDRITVYLSSAVRGRARAAYRATSHLEGDRTWSAFVERALLAEIQRRESEHNGGQQYSPTDQKLTPGRPVA